MDFEFYLTGAQSPNAFQNAPHKSLGGYISAAQVKNGSVDELFGGISEFLKLNKNSEYAMIAIKNSGSNKTGFNIKVINATDSLSIASIALVLPSKDGTGEQIFESIPDKSTSPYYAEFADASGVDIPLFKNGDVYGIWIKRELIPSALLPIPSAALITAFDTNVDISGEDDIILDINYD